MSQNHEFFATTAKGLEGLLAAELSELGAMEVSEARSGVSFSGPLETGYRICLWSRLSNRVLLPLRRFDAESADALYGECRQLPWHEHLRPSDSLAVDAVVSRSRLNHSHFAALRVKDAVVDHFRDRCGERPSVDLERPAVRLNLHLDRDQATLSLDLSGTSLHQRGYREEALEAPLKETLAAAILVRAGWPVISAEGGALVDPMCGSGTIPIEAALMAGDVAPGLLRDYYGFHDWLGHSDELWTLLLAEARQRRAEGLNTMPPIYGFDVDARAVRIARGNAARAGLEGIIHFERLELARLERPAGCGAGGLVAVNPPYGERLGDGEVLPQLYSVLGERLRDAFSGWRSAVITTDAELGRCIGLRARKSQTIYNGALKCRLLHFEIEPRWFFREVRAQDHPLPDLAQLSDGARMFANRLRKNLKTIGRWARKNAVSCYRLYDADMPEYAVAVDVYGERLHVQEYQAPESVDAYQARTRLREVMAVLPQVLEIPAERIHLKVRRRQKGTAQYEKLRGQGHFFEVAEGPARYLVNLTDYLDTGLFLDHRPMREQIRQQAAGKDFLNLFAYTGSATVCAALGGAASTTTVDLSKTYLEWARRNLALNGIREGRRHRLVQADCLEWLQREKGRYDLIFLDPPTFSNSKRMDATLDVQRDHVPLILAASRLLTPGGELVFSNNHRRFRLDEQKLQGLEVCDITERTIPRDFERNRRIHRCWRIRRSSPA